MRIHNLYNHSYRDRIHDSETVRSLNIIILSVAAGMLLFTVTGGAAFTGYASALGAGEFAFGLITALPILAGILQIYVSYLIQKTGQYKRMFLIGGVIQRISWLVVAFIPYIFPDAEHHVLMLIILVTLAAMAGSFVGVTHMSLMASIIPMEIRGQYITVRQRICTVVSLITGLSVAAFLDNIPGFLGYTIVFTIGGLGGLADILMFIWCKFPDKSDRSMDISFKESISNCFTAPKTRNFLIFWILWSFTANLSAPFYNKYAIDILGLSFTSMILFGQVVCNVLSLLIVTRWGVFIDRYGTVPTMMISGLISVIGPCVWLFAVPGSVWPLFVFNFVGGIFWCANDASCVNMQFTHTPERGRPAALAIYAVVTSISSAAAFIIGGAVLELLSPVMHSLQLTFLGTPFDHYKLLFSCTLVLRLFAVIIFLPRIESEKGMSLRESYASARADMKLTLQELAGGIYLRAHEKAARKRLDRELDRMLQEEMEQIKQVKQGERQAQDHEKRDGR